MKVEEEERQRREQDELWRHHEERCMALGVDPQLTAAFDPQTGYPCFFDHTQGIWQAYPPPQDPSTIPPGAVPPEIRPSPLYTPSPHIPPNNPHGVIPSTHLLPGDYGTNSPHIPPLPYDPPPQPHLQQPGYMDPLLPEFIPLPSGPQPQPQSLYAPQPPLPPVKLPPKWKAAKDSEGRTYYYHGEDDDDEDDDDEEIADEVKEDQRESSLVNSLSIPASISPAVELSPVPQEEDEELQKKERRREGLVQERIISPRRDEDRTDMKKYREIKEKLRRKKEQLRAKEKKKQRHRDTKQHSEKPVTVAADTSSNTERKIKDHFRLQMAGVIVQYLNPYRKPDCKKGRITNTEDFKYLARRMLVSGSWDCSIRIWQGMAEGKRIKPATALVAQLDHDAHITCLDITRDGELLVSGTQEGDLFLWYMESHLLKQKMQGHSGSVYAASFSPDGKKLVSCGEDGSFKVVDLSTGMLLYSKTLEEELRCLCWDGFTLLLGGSLGSLYVWDLILVQLKIKICAHSGNK
uniref:Set2 Rpb1 interacting domain-containing protein n=1 Tax=Timema genevievae TaxID=629358 RepID=A0A7R9PR81_TIMGE|nr:unnamed protein product [Timema genevievae]